MKNADISAVIITKNEEKDIADCIKTLPFVKEIIVVDNGSTDKTVDKAKSLGAKVVVSGTLDFSYLRNLGREKAENEWLFYIDADERVTPQLKEYLVEAVKNIGGKYCAYAVRRKNYYLGVEWPNEEKMVRLVRKKDLLGWYGSLHETPQVLGGIADIKEGILLHFTHNDISEMVEKTNQWSNLEAQLRYKSNHPKMTPWRFFRVMSTAFIKSYVTDGGYKVGTTGLIESIYQSFSIFITYAKLWEKQKAIS